MSRYDALAAELAAREEPEVVLTFDELDEIVGGLPTSARKYHAWWANKVSSQPHSRAWLRAGRLASPDFQGERAVFTLLSEEAEHLINPLESVGGDETVSAVLESTLSLERDLEDHLIGNLEALEPGLELLGRQVGVEVGRVDILARSSNGEKVVIELKVGEARESAIGQITKYMGWYARADGEPPRAILVAASFPETVRYAAAAVPGLRLTAYRVLFDFTDVSF